MTARFCTSLLVTLAFSLASPSAGAQGSPAPSSPAPSSPAPSSPAPSSPAKSHICLAPASVQTASGTADQAITAVRETFTSYLTGPSLEVAPLTARLQSQAREEAKAANCPYLLLTTIKQVHKNGGGSSFLSRAAGSAVQQGAYAAGSATGSVAGRVAGDAAGGAAGAATYGGYTQAKDELTLTSHLESADGKVLVDKTDSDKAESAGQDLLTPLVEKAATAIAAAVKSPAK